MAHEVSMLFAQYGLLLVFVSVFVDQVGAPVPSLPTLVVAGALSATGELSLPGIFLAALVACVLGDLPWYWAGRHFGGAVMRMLCRISLSPDMCVRHSQVQFERWGGRILVVAKFVPGLSTVAPPLAGATGLPLHLFLLLDGLASLLWAAAPVALGYLFAAQIDSLLATLAGAGSVALELVLALFALYVVVKWWRRRTLLIALRMSRISVQELRRAMMEGKHPLVVDVRSNTSRRLDARIVPGALLADLGCVDRTIRDVPLDHELVIYCNCPNEATSAAAAKLLMTQGYRHVRPLQGGLDAWTAAGYPVQRLPLATDVPPGSAVQTATQLAATKRGNADARA
jgi:membrane protein DedA with SNARE-associated domain/rhodanese-related sulfurtransferase